MNPTKHSPSLAKEGVGGWFEKVDSWFETITIDSLMIKAESTQETGREGGA